MKKILATLVAGLAVVAFVSAAQAGKTTVKKETVQTPTGQEKTMEINSPKAKTTVNENVQGGEIKSAEVVKQAKGTHPVLKKVVKFDSVSKDGMYITVIDREEKIRYMTNDPKRPYVVKWKKMDPIEITASYDIKAGQYVVDQTLITPSTQPMKNVTKKDIDKVINSDAPAQPTAAPATNEKNLAKAKKPKK